MTKVKAICNFEYNGSKYQQDSVLTMTPELAERFSSPEIQAVIILEDQSESQVVGAESTAATDEAAVNAQREAQIQADLAASGEQNATSTEQPQNGQVNE